MNTLIYGFERYGWAAVIIALLAFFLTQLTKQPVKSLTLKISHAGWQKLANKSILLLPLLWGMALWALYVYVFKVQGFTAAEICLAGAVAGAMAIILYGLVGGVIKGFKNPYASGEGAEVADKVIDLIIPDKINTIAAADADGVAPDSPGEVEQTPEDKAVAAIKAVAADASDTLIKKILDNIKTKKQ